MALILQLEVLAESLFLNDQHLQFESTADLKLDLYLFGYLLSLNSDMVNLYFNKEFHLVISDRFSAAFNLIFKFFLLPLELQSPVDVLLCDFCGLCWYDFLDDGNDAPILHIELGADHNQNVHQLEELSLL